MTFIQSLPKTAETSILLNQNNDENHLNHQNNLNNQTHLNNLNKNELNHLDDLNHQNKNNLNNLNNKSNLNQTKQGFAQAAIQQKGFFKANRFLIFRRLSQLLIFSAFLLSPIAGIWLIKGNLSSSLILNSLPLSDPFLLAQVLATRHLPSISALMGASLVVIFYALFGGRVFCAWVCPVNVVTDFAAWLRRRFKISAGRTLKSDLRYWILALVLIASSLTGTTVWEAINPVSITQRALIFGASLAWGITAAVFLFDLLIVPRGWCGQVCPVGATYALIGSKALLRVSAARSSQCNDCADCYAVCPEPQIIPIALKAKEGASPVILDSSCTNCGRCLDVCAPDVFTFTHRFDKRRD